MAKVIQKSKLASKIGQALKGHAQDETDYGQDFTALPPGIIGGIAQLVDAKIGVYKKGDNEGEKFIRLAGTVIEPEEVNVVRKVWQDGKVVNLPVETVKVKKLQTSRMLPLCDTKTRGGDETSADDNIAAALNELRMLGGEEFTAGLAESTDPEADLESLLETLKEAAPFFKFNTRGSTPSADFPNERTWEDWRGAVDYVPGEDGAVQDNTGNSEPPDGQSQAEADAGEDLDALAEAADRGDGEDEECVAAQNRLGELAAERSIDPDGKDKRGKLLYPTWASLVEALKTESGYTDAGAEAEWKPAKEEVYNCKLPGTKKATEVEITSVDEKKRTVNAKRLDNGNAVKGISWDLLEQ